MTDICSDNKIIIESCCIEIFNIICDKLDKLGFNNDVILEIDDKNRFNDFLFNLNYNNNVFIKHKDNIMPIKKYLEFEIDGYKKAM